MQARAAAFNCGVIPAWYTSQYTDTAQLVAASHQFAGTALLMDGEGALAHDLFIVGFDVCAEVTGSPRAHLYNARGDCNVGVWSHNQAGGFELNNFVNKEFFFQQYSDSSGKRISSYLTPVSSIAAATAAYDQMNITYDTTAGDPFVSGSTVLVQGFGTHETVSATGDANTDDCSDSAIICQVSPDSTFSNPIVGAIVKDSENCVPNNTYVSDFSSDDSTITLSQALSCPSGIDGRGDRLTLKIDNTSPFAANGRWTLSCANNPCGGRAVLLGSSWYGPTTKGTWPSGRQFATVPDATDIMPGQFACTAGTAPFCSPATGWNFATTAGGNLSIVNSGSAPWTITVGSTLNWPSYGYVKDNTTCPGEYMGYSVSSPTTIQIVSRGNDGTSTCNHNDGDTLQAAAPRSLPSPPRTTPSS